MLALAMGVRNTMVRGFGGPNLATTVLNLTLTAFSSPAPASIASGSDLGERAACLRCAILAGAVTGALLLKTSLALPLAVAAAITLLAGLAHLRARPALNFARRSPVLTPMDRDELHAIQTPLKERYEAEPEAALVTLAATGALGEGISCSVDTGRALAEAGLHPASGGDGSLLCSGDMLLEALAACAGVTLRAVATSLGIAVEPGRSGPRATSTSAAPSPSTATPRSASGRSASTSSSRPRRARRSWRRC